MLPRLYTKTGNVESPHKWSQNTSLPPGGWLRYRSHFLKILFKCSFLEKFGVKRTTHNFRPLEGSLPKQNTGHLQSETSGRVTAQLLRACWQKGGELIGYCLDLSSLLFISLTAAAICWGDLRFWCFCHVAVMSTTNWSWMRSVFYLMKLTLQRGDGKMNENCSL